MLSSAPRDPHVGVDHGIARQFAKRAHDSGRHIAIYPEGNLMAPGERERYRSGIFYLYRDLGLPVTMVDVDVALRQAFGDVFGATIACQPEETI
mgnify:CR=1 FL=1